MRQSLVALFSLPLLFVGACSVDGSSVQQNGITVSDQEIMVDGVVQIQGAPVQTRFGLSSKGARIGDGFVPIEFGPLRPP